MKKKILTVVGARPQFVKAAVLSRLITGSENLSEVMIHTGQHFDEKMSDIFFQELEIPTPAYSLSINGLSHGAMTGRMMEQIEEIAIKEKPDVILIYGDTNSTLAGALVGAKLHIPIAHVEAGLRSFNKKMPEEINRILSDHVSSLLFCPTFQAIENLKAEGITKGVFHTGDIMFDATLFAKSKVSDKTINKYKLEQNKYAVLTLHRQVNTDDDRLLQKILDYINEYADQHCLKILWPLHPRIKGNIHRYKTYNFQIENPVSYQEMHDLLHYSHSVLTDSGGLQKEAYFHAKPCVTLRSETEWVETVQAGWNRLWTEEHYQTPLKNIEDYGMGDAGYKIASHI